MISQLTENILRSVLFLVAFFPFIIKAQNSDRGCAIFNATNTHTTIGRTYRISKGITCSQSLANGSNCPLQYGGYIELERTGNFTSNGTSEDVTSLFSTIYDAILHNDFLDSTSLKLLKTDSAVGGIRNTTALVPVGKSRFVDFTPHYICVSGTVGSCATGFLDNGTVLEACSAQVLTASDALNSTYPVWDGTISIVESDKGVVANMTTNPNAVPPESAETSEGSKSGQGGLLLWLPVLIFLWAYFV